MVIDRNLMQISGAKGAMESVVTKKTRYSVGRDQLNEYLNQLTWLGI